MRKTLLTIAILLDTALINAAPSIRFSAPAQDSDKGWEEQSLPIGCGHFGANVFGLVADERIQLTHNALHIPDPRRSKRCSLTDALEIRIRTGHTNETSYARGLDLENALTWVEYTSGGVRYRREAFASYPDRVLVTHLESDTKGSLSFELAPYAPFLRKYETDRFGRKTGRRAETKVYPDHLEIYQEFNAFGIRAAACFRIITDGLVSAGTNTLSVTNATQATIIMSIETNYKLSPKIFREKNWAKKLEPTDPRPAARETLNSASKLGYAALKSRHIADYSRLFGRVKLDLGGNEEDAKLDTSELLKRYREGERCAYLEETYAQFGRYLLISSSRPGTLPANLQGIWNCHEVAPWGSGYWHNINVQMNYWPAFNGNLAECFEAYADFNEAVRGTKSRCCYQFIRRYTPESLPDKNEPEPDWWVLGTANYPYLSIGGPNPDGHDGPGIGGLTTRLFTDWWEFTQDKDILAKRVFPALHGMANFLVRTVRNYDGKYLAVFSASPEQVCQGKRVDWYDEEIGVAYYHTIGCAFDQQLIWQNNHDLLVMADILKTNDLVIAKCREQIDSYDPVQIGTSGQIKEFREEQAYGEIGEKQHRHISHLMGLMPGTLISRKTPEWLEAAKRTLELRGERTTGWALAHRLNAWARTGNSEKAHHLLNCLIATRTYDNLWDWHPPFQIDGNFGATAGVIEMLIQSHEGHIELLPALPKVWAKKGSFKGLCARGAFEVDCVWKDGVPTKVTVKSKKGAKADVRFRGKKITFEEKD
ncbi:MAG: glycoside hydrolase family 95 protein [Kiritimatiellae bacterium]|nr:glycoside hydrolase family 95 protein [Kiritimatiellia bacterium]